MQPGCPQQTRTGRPFWTNRPPGWPRSHPGLLQEAAISQRQGRTVLTTASGPPVRCRRRAPQHPRHRAGEVQVDKAPTRLTRLGSAQQLGSARLSAQQLGSTRLDSAQRPGPSWSRLQRYGLGSGFASAFSPLPVPVNTRQRFSPARHAHAQLGTRRPDQPRCRIGRSAWLSSRSTARVRSGGGDFGDAPGGRWWGCLEGYPAMGRLAGWEWGSAAGLVDGCGGDQAVHDA
jgi:hypothetical protein